MSKEKAEIITQRQTRKSIASNQKPKQVTTKSKNDDTKKSTDDKERNHLKKTIVHKTEISSSKSTTIKNVASRISSDKIAKPNEPKKVIKSTKFPGKATSDSTSKNISRISSKEGTKLTSRDVTSKRVTKEQYFPKKYPFSSYLHDNKDDKANKTSDKKPKAKTEVINTSKKLLKDKHVNQNLASIEFEVVASITKNISTDHDRPKTATIRKSDDNNKDLPEIAETNTRNEILNENSSNKSEEEYEDDFDSYESDFEPYISSDSSTEDASSIEERSDTSTSDINEFTTEPIQKRTNSAGTEEERKLDSGNYDLPEMKHKQILDNIKETVEKDNFSCNENLGNLASLSDEGFEDGSKTSILNTGFVNFIDARKKQQLMKLRLKRKKRTDYLMEMVRLDGARYSLFSMTAIKYESFIRSYGRIGTIQMFTQTGDDNVHEEVQTDSIEMTSKLVQFPIRYSKDEDFTQIYLSQMEKIQNVDRKALKEFVLSAGNLILNILHQRELKPPELKTIYSTDNQLFSDGYFDLNVEAVPLKNKNISYITCSKKMKLLTVHKGNIQRDMEEDEALLSRPMICVWNVLEPHEPICILTLTGEFSQACFDALKGNLVIAGVRDGTICVWDLCMNSELYYTPYDKVTNRYYNMRNPIHITAPIIRLQRNTNSIVSIRSFTAFINEPVRISSYREEIEVLQVVSLDELGNVVVWKVVRKPYPYDDPEEDNKPLTLKGHIKLVQGQVINLQKCNPNLKELLCYDLQFNKNEFHHFFIASNYGVLHCLFSGLNPTPKIYKLDISPVTCLEISPFLSNYFFAGSRFGSVKLFSRYFDIPLRVLCPDTENSIDNECIELIAWSNAKPCMVFIKNRTKKIHIWNFDKSDMIPAYTIPISENISAIEFLPTYYFEKERINYMAMVSKDYGVRIHKLNKDFSHSTLEDYENELVRFIEYAKRL